MKDRTNQDINLVNEKDHVVRSLFGKENRVNNAAAKPGVVLPSTQRTLSSFTVDEKFIRYVQNNPYGRFAPSAAKQGFAIIEKNETNGKVDRIWQSGLIRPFKPLQDRPLVNASVAYNHTGLSEVRAHTPTKQTLMVGNVERSLHFTLSDNEQVTQGLLVPTSPEARRRIVKKNFPVFKPYIKVSQAVLKGVNESIIGVDVEARSNKKKRRCSQNKVMGNQSALSCMQSFALRQQSILNAQAYQFLNQAHKVEWLHLLAHSLTPLYRDPQQQHNLGAALARDNTRMMVIENIIKFLSQFIDVAMQVDASFIMVPGSQIIQSIQYAVIITYKDRTLILQQFFNVFSHYDFPRQSDQLLLFAVLALLTNQNCQSVSLASKASTLAVGLSSSTVASKQSQPRQQGSENNSINVSINSKSKRKLTLFATTDKITENRSIEPALNKRVKM